VRAIPNIRRLSWIAAGTLVAVAAITLGVMRPRGAPVIVNDLKSTFRVESVSVTRGTLHTLYYPSRFVYFTKEAGRFVGLRHLPETRRIDHYGSLHSVGLWIKWSSSDGRLSVTQAWGSFSGGPRGSFVAGVSDPVRKSGVFLWVGNGFTNDLAGKEFLLNTWEGRATIKFR
jgi:hypothetical protein